MLSCIFFLWFAVLIVRSKLRVGFPFYYPRSTNQWRILPILVRNQKGNPPICSTMQGKSPQKPKFLWFNKLFCRAGILQYFAKEELWLPSQQFLTRLNSCCYSLELERQYREETRRIEEQRQEAETMNTVNLVKSNQWSIIKAAF